jgi:hypothetical protein
MTTYTTAQTAEEIADFIAEESASPAFEQAFTETLDGFRMGYADDETDTGLPLAREAELATEMVVRTFFDLFRDTRLESIADRIAWGMVHSLHKVADGLDGEADKAARKVRDLVRDADGSEVLTAELEEAQMICQSLDEARDAVACMRDHAAQTFAAETGRPWSAPRGSLVSSKRTASVVAAADFLAARRQQRIDRNAPNGPIVIFSGGQAWADDRMLWDRLDSIRQRIPAMVLATTAQDKGCDAIAAAWAASRKVPLIAFTLGKWRHLGQRAGFARNEAMLALDPVEALVCEGGGLQSHLARGVKGKGVPAHFFRLRDQRAAAA